jgi:hypothetical protein
MHALHHLQLIYMPGPHAAIGAALKLPSDNMTGVCKTGTAMGISERLMFFGSAVRRFKF